jgi:hypothetical protein
MDQLLLCLLHMKNQHYPIIALICLSPVAYAQSDGSQFAVFAGFEIGQVTLGQIEERLGPALLVETGDAGEYEASICYRVPAGLIYFLSGEMGGPGHKLLGFGVRSNDPAQPCSELPANRAPANLNLAGLRLGMSDAEYARLVATEVRWEGDIGRAFIESKRPMTPAELNRLPSDFKEAALSGRMQNYFDVVVTVAGTFSRHKLIEFRVWRVETY